MNNSPETLPYSIRFTPDEKLRFEAMAQNLGLSKAALLRLKLFSADFKESYNMLTMKRAERRELAQILVALGKSRIANNLNQIACAVNTGTLEITPDVISQINEAYEAVMWMRGLLVASLGVKS